MTKAKPTAFTVPEVPGSKRASLRPYTHALVGRFGGEAAAQIAELAHKEDAGKNRRYYTTNWNYYHADAKRTVGEVRRNYNGFAVAVRDYEVESAQKFVAEHPTLEGYLQGHLNAHTQYVARLRAQGNGELFVLQWSMSRANAEKAMSTFRGRGYIDLRVVECVPVGKAPEWEPEEADAWKAQDDATIAAHKAGKAA